MTLDEAIRYIKKHSRKKNNCLVFTGGQTGQGYGAIWIDGKCMRIHKVMAHSYGMLDVNDTTLMILHAIDCPNKHCFKEEHLRVGTRSENTQDVVEARGEKYHRPWCSKGHLKEGHNLLILRDKIRRCRICYINNYKKYNKRFKK